MICYFIIVWYCISWYNRMTYLAFARTVVDSTAVATGFFSSKNKILEVVRADQAAFQILSFLVCGLI